MFTVECTIFVLVTLVLGHAIACDVLFCTTALPLGRFVQLMWLLVQPVNAISPYMKYTVAKDFLMQCHWKEREATLVDLTQKVSNHIRHMRVVDAHRGVSAGSHMQRGSTPCCRTPPATVAAQQRTWTSRSSDDPVGTPQLAAGSPAVYQGQAVHLQVQQVGFWLSFQPQPPPQSQTPALIARALIASPHAPQQQLHLVDGVGPLRQHQWTCVGTQADIFRVTKRSPWIYLSPV